MDSLRRCRRATRTAAVIGALLVASWTAGCRGRSSTPLSLVPVGDLRADDYEWALDRWTRSDEIYQQLDSVAFMHATYHAPEFRKAFGLRHTDVYGPGSEEASRLLLTRPDAESAHEFFLSVATTETRWNDFDRPDSIWRVTLQGDDREPVDADVERIKVNANLRAIYPFISSFAKTYAVRFRLTGLDGQPVLTGQTRRLSLRIASALGEATLFWDFEPVSRRRSN